MAGDFVVGAIVGFMASMVSLLMLLCVLIVLNRDLNETSKQEPAMKMPQFPFPGMGQPPRPPGTPMQTGLPKPMPKGIDMP